MSNEVGQGVRPNGPRTAQVIEVIETQALRGRGEPDDPCRIVQQYWTRKGSLLAERDDETGNGLDRGNDLIAALRREVAQLRAEREQAYMVVTQMHKETADRMVFLLGRPVDQAKGGYRYESDRQLSAHLKAMMPRFVRVLELVGERHVAVTRR